jgi:hypothetical protein
MREGRYLVTETNGVNAMSLSGSVEWSTPGGRLPWDTNEISADRYLTADHSTLAQIVVFNGNGKALWMYRLSPDRRSPAQPPLTGAAASQRRHLRH